MIRQPSTPPTFSTMSLFKFTVLQFALLAVAFHYSTASFTECPPPNGNETVKIPHPDCTKFIVCDGGRETVLDCPPGTYYNPREEYCDFPANVPECVGGTRPPIGEPSTTTEGPVPTTTEEPQPPTTTEEPRPTTTEEPRPTTTEEPTYPTTTEAPEPTHETTTEGRETTIEPPDYLTSCGDTITANSGLIRYKLNQTYARNEICAFVIRTLDHGGFVFTLNSHGISLSDPNAINIFTYNRNGQIDSAHLGPPNPLNTAYVSGSIAVVIFRTKTINGTGFELSFEGVGSTAYEDGIQMVYSDLEGGSMTVPFWANFSGTTNVFVLTANHTLLGAFDQVKLTLSDEDLYRCGQGCGCDSVRTYSFVSDSAGEEGLFCDENLHKSIYSTNGVLIVIFRKFYDGAWGKVTLTWRIGRF